jgi:hypothetical protein
MISANANIVWSLKGEVVMSEERGYGCGVGGLGFDWIWIIIIIIVILLLCPGIFGGIGYRND